MKNYEQFLIKRADARYTWSICDTAEQARSELAQAQHEEPKENWVVFKKTVTYERIL